MVTTEKEALYHNHHEEQLYSWERISENIFETLLKYFLDILKEFNSEKAASERARLNSKYKFNLT